MISQIAKYLPGNVLHFVGRHALGVRAGADHARLLRSSVTEIAGLVCAAGLLLLVSGPWRNQDALPFSGGVPIWVLAVVLVGLCMSAALGLTLWYARRQALRPISLLRIMLKVIPIYILFFLCSGLILWGLCISLGFGLNAPIEIISAASGSWIIGYLTPGAPAGIGVRDASLSILLGRKPAEVARGLHLTEQPIPPAVPPGLPSDLLQRRPDILKVEQDLAAATATIGVAQANRFPQLALTGAVGGAGVRFSGDSNGPFAIFKGSASLTGPIFNASALGYQVRAQEAVTQAAIAQYRKTVLTAFQEVEDALIAVQKTGEQRTALEQQVAALQSAYRLADFRYQGGRASYLDALTAQRDLFTSELTLARTRRAQLQSVVQLYKVLGGGWPPEVPGKQTEAAGNRREATESLEAAPAVIH